MKALEIVLVAAVLCFLGILVYGGVRDAERDDTDPPGARSGMRLFVDHRTGCHYLGNPRGGITPRVDGTGRQVCEMP